MFKQQTDEIMCGNLDAREFINIHFAGSKNFDSKKGFCKPFFVVCLRSQDGKGVFRVAYQTVFLHKGKFVG